MTPPSQPAPPHIFSDTKRRAAFRRAVARQSRSGAARFLFDDMREEVKERLSFMRFEPRKALIIGDPARLLSAELQGGGAWVDSLPAGEWNGERPLDRGLFDLIVHDTSLATINDLPGALLHLREALTPDGLLIASIVGAGSLPALRAAILAAEAERPHPRLHPLIDNHAASALLQRTGYARQVVDTHNLTVRYGALRALVADLRDQGLSNVLNDIAPPLGRAATQNANKAFHTLADDDGRVSETFAIVTLTAWRS